MVEVLFVKFASEPYAHVATETDARLAACGWVAPAIFTATMQRGSLGRERDSTLFDDVCPECRRIVEAGL